MMTFWYDDGQETLQMGLGYTYCTKNLIQKQVNARISLISIVE